MKGRNLRYFLTGTAALIVFCAQLDNAGGLGDHPVPATPGILPLQTNNRWVYYYQVFDSTGNRIAFPSDTLILEISGVYLRSGDTLQDVEEFIYGTEVEKENLVYRYEWDNRDNGYLVSHKSTGKVDERGLYIVGEFQGADWKLFDTVRLWYSYPCEQNVSWEVLLPGEERSISIYKCLSTEDTAWVKEKQRSSMSPLLFLNGCYIYKQEVDEYTYYHQFHPDYGKISCRGYKDGVLRECYYLVDWDMSE